MRKKDTEAEQVEPQTAASRTSLHFDFWARMLKKHLYCKQQATQEDYLT